MTVSLFDQLHDYLGQARSDWKEIAEACEVDRSWIYKFVRGEINDPGVLRTERILKYARKNGWKPSKASARPVNRAA